MARKNVLVIIGSASENSSNERLAFALQELFSDYFKLYICNDLKKLPHFDPEQSSVNPPLQVREFREKIEKADGVVICTPEYIFSIPSVLKNALEWCVATTVFTGKPLGIITASAHGQKGHEELQMIMRTLMAEFSEETLLLIQGIKGKINEEGFVSDNKTKDDLIGFARAFESLIRHLRGSSSAIGPFD